MEQSWKIEEIASHLGVSQQAAYGLMQFLKEIGQVEITEAPSNGKRGRRPKLYKISLMADLHIQGIYNAAFPVQQAKPTSVTPETDYIGFLG